MVLLSCLDNVDQDVLSTTLALLGLQIHADHNPDTLGYLGWLHILSSAMDSAQIQS